MHIRRRTCGTWREGVEGSKFRKSLYLLYAMCLNCERCQEASKLSSPESDPSLCSLTLQTKNPEIFDRAMKSCVQAFDRLDVLKPQLQKEYNLLLATECDTPVESLSFPDVPKKEVISKDTPIIPLEKAGITSFVFI